MADKSTRKLIDREQLREEINMIVDPQFKGMSKALNEFQKSQATSNAEIQNLIQSLAGQIDAITTELFGSETSGRKGFFVQHNTMYQEHQDMKQRLDIIYPQHNEMYGVYSIAKAKNLIESLNEMAENYTTGKKLSKLFVGTLGVVGVTNILLIMQSLFNLL